MGLNGIEKILLFSFSWHKELSPSMQTQSGLAQAQMLMKYSQTSVL